MNLFQMNLYHWVALTVGVVAGASVVMYHIKKKRKQNPYFSVPTMNELIEHQKVCNEMTLAIAVNWVQEQKEQFKNMELLYIIGKVNENTVNMFTMDCTVLKTLDADRYIFLLAVEKEKKLPVAIQLVNLESVEEELEKMLKEDGYCVIEDN